MLEITLTITLGLDTATSECVVSGYESDLGRQPRWAEIAIDDALSDACAGEWIAAIIADRNSAGTRDDLEFHRKHEE